MVHISRYHMQEPKSLSEGLSILKDQVVVSQRDAIIKEKQESDEKMESQKQKLTTDVMSQIQKRRNNKYIAFKFPKNADKNIKVTLLKEICKTFSDTARLYSMSKLDRKSYSGTYVAFPADVRDNSTNHNTWVLIDNRRPESKTHNIIISISDLKKALK